jgi:shikimate dehydrogenase
MKMGLHEADSYLIGIIGWPVGHSKSPAMHQAAAASLGIDLTYLTLPVQPADLPEAIQDLPNRGLRGANITVPHKEVVIPLLDLVDPAASAIGAVNTIVIRYSTDSLPVLAGYNTDWSGFSADIQDLGVHVDNRQCYVMGAGGSARAVTYALAQLGGEIHVYARRPDQAVRLVDDLSQHFPNSYLYAHAWVDLPGMIRQAQSESLIINTTPLGMFPRTEMSPWPENLRFPAEAMVYDLVYNPSETRLLSQAKQAGCDTANGLGMLVHQGAEAFRLWTGVDPNPEIMASAIS